ncbi:MAG: hypothetical protein K2H92_08595, partial [Bacteroidaceae bacterium]|nr:hypothetical protein [Bacteroidaceae bacterium]
HIYILVSVIPLVFQFHKDNDFFSELNIQLRFIMTFFVYFDGRALKNAPNGHLAPAFPLTLR